MAGVRQIRDPIHNFIELSEKEAKIVDTRVFQRLRGIRQLAMAMLVYPGALHTRFEHSLGVMHVAGMMVKRLDLGEGAIERARYAALLHDIGHGPFSHVSEYALDLYGDRSKLPEGQKKDKIHELVTTKIIETDPDIVKALGPRVRDETIGLLAGNYGEPALKAAVSGPLDADKQDYLLRDSYFCGVRYGVFDIHQFQRSLVSEGINQTRDVMLNPDGVHAVEQYVMAKYYMTTNVYRHKVRLVTDQMIVRAITLGIDKDGIEPLLRLYSFDNSEDFVRNYREWDDAKFMHVFGGEEHRNTKCQLLLERLSHRRLLKRVFQERARDFSATVRETVVKLSNPALVSRRKEIEAEVAARLSEEGEIIDSDFVILHSFSIKSVREMSLNDESGILVNGDHPESFLEKSSLFASIQKGFEEQFVEVYAPMKWSSPEGRKDVCDRLREPVWRIIEKICGRETKRTEA